MSPAHRVMLASSLLLACGEGVIEEPPTTDDLGECLGGPCADDAECQVQVAGSACDVVSRGTAPVCYFPCDISAAEPGCDCVALTGAQFPCGPDGCTAGYCSPAPPSLCGRG